MPIVSRTRRHRGLDAVARAYDAWTRDGVLERLWGEHIHHGYYRHGRVDGGFRRAKVEMIDRLLAWAEIERATTTLDLGCGIGGSARHLATVLGSTVVGVTVSEAQAGRARALTPPDASRRVTFLVADAAALPFANDSFDFVWSCEAAEHMPDKPRVLHEIVRVLRPGGRLLLATWCRRSEPPALDRSERALLGSIRRAWALPDLVPLHHWVELAGRTPGLTAVRTADWSVFASPTWRHQLTEGWSALPWLLRRPPATLLRTVRDAVAVTAMISAYDRGLVRYGLLAATKTEDAR